MKAFGPDPIEIRREDSDDESPKLGSYLSLGWLGKGLDFLRL